MAKSAGQLKKDEFEQALAVIGKPEDFSDPPPAFGWPMRNQEFMFEEGTTFCNQASFGGIPCRSYRNMIMNRVEFERNPDKGERLDEDPKWIENITPIAEFVGCPVDNLNFCENTTAGISNVLTTYPFKAGDAILVNSHTFVSMNNQVDAVLDRVAGVKKVVVQYPFPKPFYDEQVIVDLHEQAMKANRNIKVCIIDHVGSEPSIRYPAKKVVDLCHKYGIFCIVDGAQAIGQLEFRIEDIGADVYVGNLHKWCYTGRGSAVQYIKNKDLAYNRPGRVGSTYRQDYPTDFIHQGTRDCTPFHTAKFCLRFWNWIGGHKAIKGYIKKVFDQAIPMLKQRWGTDLLQIPDSMVTHGVRMMELPIMPTYPASGKSASRLTKDLYYRFKVWAPCAYFGDEKDGKMFMRISCNIYNQLEDYERIADVICSLRDEPCDCAEQLQSIQQHETCKRTKENKFICY